MEMTGEYRIPARREVVWAALNDPEILKASIPGCELLDKTSDTTMTGRVVAKVGPVKATFNGDVTLQNLDPPAGYTISGEGKGGVAGFAKGGADVRLVEDGDATVLSYVVKAQVGGKLAQLGARLIDSTAKKMADEFFGNFAARVGAAAPAAAAPVAEADAPLVEAPPLAGPAPAAPEGTLRHAAQEIEEAAREAEEEIEVAAGRGFLGGPYVWGLLALVAVIVVIGLMTR
ncbi:SRPBCC family protein [Prosthecomicrobium pneumaticum]|uniref:Carbon monoxide dehydrogenase n=1 Tax=Prosthecomicrobium pneumaticum TaxID=81895 RepID=A0A7W9L239_9HYPH|nr:carbon monoxide dehydrogenase subunit G [Prosthecomicrobium pneumaticum]MBB5753204.1 hypothetical protein [Prosthecomicrobium pneumaticum]